MHEMFLLIPILGISCGLLAIFGGVIIRPLHQIRMRKLEIEAELAREKLSIDSARHERLEQRLAVIERIVTDRGMGLSDEIERLRDKPLN